MRPGPLPVLHQDEVLIIVNKPSGLAAHRGWDRDPQGYVLTRVRDQCGGRHVYLGHRLDRATSGAIALVRDPAAQAPLQRAFASRQVDKRYLALVRGVPPRVVHVDYPVPRAGRRDPVRVPARTRVRRLAVFEGRYALVEAIPFTGRLHQLRRHLAHLRHPIVGDTSYGDGAENRRMRARFGLHRLALHAHKLALPHPQSGQRVEARAPLPADLAGPLSAMGVWPCLETLG